MTDRPRRRTYQDDASDEEAYRKRRRGVPVYKENLDRLFSRLYTKSSTSLESNLESLANELEQDIDAHMEDLVDIVSCCVLVMPNRLTIFSTLVGLLNAKKHNFGSELLEKLMMELRDKMEQNNYFRATNLIVFMSDLVNCRVVSLTSLVEFLESLLEAAFEDEIPQVRSDWFVYTVLHCLPWIGQEMQDKSVEALNNLLDGIEHYMKSRTKDYMNILQVWSASSHEQEEYLDCLWAQVSKLRSDGWKEEYITRHYVAFDGALTGALQHNLPSFQPPRHSPDCIYPLPRVIFRLFDYTDCPEEGPLLPGVHSIERFLVEEELFWIIEQYCGSRKECAAQLLDYSKRSLVPLNYVILEVVFAELFRLPEPPTRELFFGSLLIELCKNQAMSMPQVLAQAAELFYQRLDSMHPICVNRLVDWFSFHISNFEYQWSWPDWKDCITMDKLAPKRIFVRELLEKCMRLSYHERLSDFLPAYFECMMPEKPKICYYLDDEDNPAHELAVQFDRFLRERKAVEDVIPLLGKDPDALATFLSVLLNTARTTFSHSFAALTRFYRILKDIVATREDMQMVILTTVYDLWKTHHQMMVLLVRKLHVMSLLEAQTIVAWIFREDMRKEFDRLWVWEILCFTLQHCTAHVKRACAALAEMRAKAESNKKAKEAEGEDVEMDSPKPEEEGEENGDNADDELIAKENEVTELREFLKNLLLNVLHKFTVLLTEHIVNCETEGKDYNTDWYRLMTGRFQGIFLSIVRKRFHNNQNLIRFWDSESLAMAQLESQIRWLKHWEVLWELRDALATELFKPSTIDANVLRNYNQFIALRS